MIDDKESLKRRCLKIIQELRKDYPMLDNAKIYLKIKKLRKGSLWANKAFYLYYLIKVDPEKYKGASDEELKGGLAHELIHLEDAKKMNLFEFIVFFLKYNLSKKFAQNLELLTDKGVIERGYARELYANRKFRFKNLSEKDKKIMKNYFDPEGVKKYAQSMGKW